MGARILGFQIYYITRASDEDSQARIFPSPLHIFTIPSRSLDVVHEDARHLLALLLNLLLHLADGLVGLLVQTNQSALCVDTALLKHLLVLTLELLPVSLNLSVGLGLRLAKKIRLLCGRESEGEQSFEETRGGKALLDGREERRT